MNLSPEHIDALRALRTLSPQDRVAAMHHQEQLDLHAAERGKLALSFRLSAEEWANLKSHVRDGGGVTEAHRVVRILLTAILDDDQDTFWPELVHLLKAAGKHHGVITVQDGMVTLNGVGPTPQEVKEKNDVGF